jgi:ATP-dependent Lon protease
MRPDRTDANRDTRAANSGVLVIPDDSMVIVPVRNVVLFPGMILPLTIGREQSILAAQQAVKTERPVGILLQRDAEIETPGPDDLCLVGTVANILRYVTLPDNTHVIVCQGLQRFRVAEYLQGYPFPVARIGRIDEPEATDSEIEARLIQLRERALKVLQYLPQVSQELVNAVKGIAQPGRSCRPGGQRYGTQDRRSPESPRIHRPDTTTRHRSRLSAWASRGACNCHANSTSEPRQASTSGNANTSCVSN